MARTKERVYKVIGTFKKPKYSWSDPNSEETYTISRRYFTKAAANWRKNYWESAIMVKKMNTVSVDFKTSHPIIYEDD